MYNVNDKVLAKVGSQWVSAIITKPANKLGNYGIRFKVGKKTINYLANEDQLKFGE